jgi:hypothetical protein
MPGTFLMKLISGWKSGWSMNLQAIISNEKNPGNDESWFSLSGGPLRLRPSLRQQGTILF